MGYDTQFDGKFTLDKPLELKHFNYLNAFSGMRHTKRNCEKTRKLDDPIRNAVNYPVGREGEFYVGGSEDNGSVIDDNNPPESQPSLWCDWVPSEDGTAIEHNCGEKFCNYIEWIQYLLENFLIGWGYKVNGSVKWQGEEINDRGIIQIKNNKITIEKLK